MLRVAENGASQIPGGWVVQVRPSGVKKTPGNPD